MRSWHSLPLAALVSLGVAICARAEPPGKSFRDCANCPEMVAIPPGSFTMGTSTEEEMRQGVPQGAFRRGAAQPLHVVTISRSFAIAKYPATVAEFRAFVQESGYQGRNSCYSYHMIDGRSVYESISGYSWRDPGIPQTDAHPVVCIDWNGAKAYTAWLSRKSGHEYRLPSEAEYEYAARAGTRTSFYWGDKRDETACQYANLADLSEAKALGGKVPMGPEYRVPCDDGYAYTSPVGHYKPNAFDLYDMLGNVWELVEDCWNPNYKGAPTDGSPWETGDCDLHPIRGGSFGNTPWFAFVGARAVRDADYRGHSFGFRVVTIR